MTGNSDYLSYRLEHVFDFYAPSRRYNPLSRIPESLALRKLFFCVYTVIQTDISGRGQALEIPIPSSW